MGDRYIITIICPKCEFKDEAYYAPTCGFIDWKCPKCHAMIDLGEYSGISYEDCSNADLLRDIVNSFKR